jgi:hypothetical protein
MLPRADIDQNLLVAWYGKPVESKRSAVGVKPTRNSEGLTSGAPSCSRRLARSANR